MNKKIVIRCDGGRSVGMGHVVRCVALASILKEHFSISFAIQETSAAVLTIIQSVTKDILILPIECEPEKDVQNFLAKVTDDAIVVADGYHLNQKWQKLVKDSRLQLVYIDDLHAGYQYADVVINQSLAVTEDDYQKTIYTQLYLGSSYLLLRPEFLQVNLAKAEKAGKVLISMGAADTNNLTLKFARALSQIAEVKEIHLLLGAVNPHLSEIEEWAQTVNKKIVRHIQINAGQLVEIIQASALAICPASSVSLECCAVGIPLISGYSAHNQISNLKGLDQAGAILDLEDLNQVEVPKIKQAVQELLLNKPLSKEMVNKQQQLVDKQSGDRILNIFQTLAEEQLTFRMADATDAGLYFEWANDPLVRRLSYNQQMISYKQHINWFTKKIEDKNSYFYLFLKRKDLKPAGQVRIVKEQTETVIGISVDQGCRGQFLGWEMLSKAVRSFHEKNKEAITAYIKTENYASYHLFLKAGFIQTEVLEISGSQSYKMLKYPI